MEKLNNKIYSIKDIKPYTTNINIKDNEVVLGFDEWKNKWIKVQYRRDSNRFFDYPYNKSFYSKERMNKYKKL